MNYISEDIRKIVLELQNKIGKDIIFTGSIEDVAHTGKALNPVGDIDVLITRAQLDKAIDHYDLINGGPSWYNWFLEKEDKIRYITDIGDIKVEFFIYVDSNRRDKVYSYNAEGLTVYTRGIDYKIKAVDTMLEKAESIDLEWFLDKFSQIKKLYDNANTTYLDFSG